MATENTTTRFSGTLSVGGRVLSSLLTAAAGGALVLGGGQLLFDESQTTYVTIEAGTGSILSYAENTCTNTGGLTTYTHCSIQNTATTTGLTGTGIVQILHYDANKAPNASRITCVTSGNQGTGTGYVFFKYGVSGSGRSIGWDSGTGSTALVPPNHFIRCWSNNTPGNVRAQLRVWMTEQYAP